MSPLTYEQEHLANLYGRWLINYRSTEDFATGNDLTLKEARWIITIGKRFWDNREADLAQNGG